LFRVIGFITSNYKILVLLLWYMLNPNLFSCYSSITKNFIMFFVINNIFFTPFFHQFYSSRKYRSYKTIICAHILTISLFYLKKYLSKMISILDLFPFFDNPLLAFLFAAKLFIID